MDGTEFVRRAKRYARNAGLEFQFERSEGKGSYGRLYLGGKATLVKRSEIGRGCWPPCSRNWGYGRRNSSEIRISMPNHPP